MAAALFACVSSRSTSAIDSTFGNVRPRFGPDRIAAGSSLRMFSAEQEAKQVPQRRELSRDARRLEAALVEIGEIAAHVVGGRARKGRALAREK